VKALQCDMPQGCSLRRDIDKYYLWDSFEIPLSRTDIGMQDLYLGIFAHPTRTFKFLMVIRNAVVSMFGIKGPTVQQLNHIEIRKTEYAVGEKMALFRLISRSDVEIVAGGEDRHLDFRVSVLRIGESGVNRVVVTTAVDAHNLFGKVYLFFIMPFHRWGVRTILDNALAAHRI
jgi:hypothetical protein